jgi:hypothetical protein
MLIKFYRSSYIIQYLLLIIIFTGIWLPGFLANQGIPVKPSSVALLYNPAYYLLSLSAVANPIVAVIILLVCALALNNILILNEIIPANNLLPALLFIVVMGSDPLILSSYPVLLAMPLFIGFIHIVFKMNDDPEGFIVVFNASLIISAMSLLYPAAIILIVYLWIILMVYGIVTIRKLLISIIAFILPFLYVAAYFYWKDSLQSGLDSYLHLVRNIFVFRIDVDPWQILIWSVFVILMLIPSLYRLITSLSTYNINYRRKMAATTWLLVFTLAMMFISGPVNFNTMVLVPASIIIATIYSGIRKTLMSEIILMSFILLVAAHNYLYLLNAESLPF